MYPASILRLAIHARNVAPCCLLKANRVAAVSVSHVHHSPLRLGDHDSHKKSKKIALQPVPKLGDTMERFIVSCQPLLKPDELKTTVAAALKFAGSDGKDGPACELQCKLKERAATHENWLADWWLKAAYLDYRNPLVGWSSPGTPFAARCFESENEFLCYAANVVLGALRFKSILDNNELKPEKLGKMPLDMQQYYKVLGTCRMPGEKTDCLQYTKDSDYIVVACNNHFYVIYVYDECCEPISQKQLVEQLRSIRHHSKEPAPPVGLLTTQHRDKWGKDYALLTKHKCNKACVKYIQKSLFLLCLDKCIDKYESENGLTRGGVHTIHGGGSMYNSGNRWFDKTVQFVVSEDGFSGITYEHSPAEGVPVTAMGDFIQDYVKEGCGNDTKDADLDDPCPRSLIFKVDPDLKHELECAGQEVDKFIKDFDLKVFKFDNFGKEDIKGLKFSPDSFIQMAFQLAYYRVHCKPVAQYEACMMRHFLHGRTATIRSCSCASVDFAKAMLADDCEASEKLQLMQCAIDAHKEYVKACLKGDGVDRHFLGLKMIAIENKQPVDPLFSDPGFIKSSTWLMSTSQVPTKFEGFMGFGPVYPNGYGVCYNPRPDDIIFSVASLAHSKETSTKKLVEAIKASLNDMMDVACKGGKSKL